MDNRKGNQKHLTLSQRIEIEKDLLSGKNFATIAKEIGNLDLRRAVKYKKRRKATQCSTIMKLTSHTIKILQNAVKLNLISKSLLLIT